MIFAGDFLSINLWLLTTSLFYCYHSMSVCNCTLPHIINPNYLHIWSLQTPPPSFTESVTEACRQWKPNSGGLCFSNKRSSGSGHTVTEHWPWAQEMKPTVIGHLAEVAKFNPVWGQSFTIIFNRWRLFLVRWYCGIITQLCYEIMTAQMMHTTIYRTPRPKFKILRHLF